MVLCWAPGCNHYNQRETCRFFKFPTEPRLRAKWKQLVRRSIEPGSGAFLCSCHFPDGRKENGPKLFEYNREKRFAFSSPEKKCRCTDSRDIESKVQDNETSEPVPASSELQPSKSLQASAWGDPQPSTSHELTASRQVPALDELQPSTSWQASILDESQPSTSQEVFVSSDSAVVDAENYFLLQEINAQKRQLQYFSNRMSFDSIADHNTLVLLYTGLPSKEIFESVYNLVSNLKINYYFHWNVEKLNRKDQLLLTLMKLRQNAPHLDLAYRFGISQATVSNIVITWIHVLHQILFKKLMNTIPAREKNRTCLPNCCSTFTNCRIIIDCTDIFTAVPRSSMATQRVTYSAYKHRNTCKGLIGVAPNGVITYISGLYPGSTSDKKIVQHSGILDQMVPGDLILADKGFLIRDLLPPGVALNIPPFLSTAQFSPEQIRQTECIARARIHVERAIRRMKVYRILSFIPSKLIPYAEEVFQTVGALTNLQYPLIREVEQYFLVADD
ncbi:uncharacterized protein LOC116162686 [Photinus pyralis]|uniref:uncharacterized protein LOC116162686 n=1 Tax=Photinus pyralis TaxID=7054 RepID=UPI001267175A|nr:uncharacterized protein LOC116162686 [Photinus pyralis]